MKSRLILLAATACALLNAQQDRGLITGVVKDSTGAIIPDAAITATRTETNAITKVSSASSGDYTLPSLEIGTYTVRVEKQGFKAAIAKDIIVSASGTARLDITLEVGTTQQAIEVTAAGVQVQTENARIQTAVANRLVDQLPLVVGGQLRSPFDLALLAPEVKAPNDGNNNFSIGGGQAATYGVSLDGVSSNTGRALQTQWAAMNTPSLDAISEFTVDSNGFKAEYGRAQGGQMSFVSKSGTNEFHGNLFEFLRNDALDAGFYNKATKKPVYKQHDFGGTFGGPIWIPKIYNGKNKSFFFVSYEGFRNREGANPSFLSVAPREFYDGNFTNWVDNNNNRIAIFDPTTGGSGTRSPFPNNQIPAARFDSIFRAMSPIGQTALPNVAGITPGTSAYVRNNFIQTGTQVAPWDKFSIRGDHNFNEKHRMSFYYSDNKRSSAPGAAGPIGLPGFLNGNNYNNTTSKQYRISWDWTISSNKINRFFAGGNDWREINRALAVGARPWKDTVCLGNVPDCNNNLLNVSLADFTGWGGPSDNGSDNAVYSFNDDFSWIKGKHSFKMGGLYEMVNYSGFGQQNIMGQASFNRRVTGQLGDLANLTGSGFASFMLGGAVTGNIHTPRYVAQRFPYYGGYFQDDWRVNQKLTINYGIRYDVNVSPFSADDQFSDFNPTRPNPGANGRPGALVFAGTGEGREGRRRLVDTWYGGWGPRLSLAYSLNDKTVIRAGAARTFGAVRAVGGSTHFQGFVQIYDTPQVDPQGFNPTFQLQNGFPAWPKPPFLVPDFNNYNSQPWWQGNEVSRAPENLTYTFNLQRQINKDTVLEVGYNYVRGTNLQAGLLNYNQLNLASLPANLSPFTAAGRTLLNSPISSPAAQAAGLTKPFASFRDNLSVAWSRRPFPQYSTIDTAGGNGDRSGSSKYHAFVLKLEKRYSSGLTFLTSYVFSKILTDADSAWVGGAAMDQNNRSLEYSIGQLDQTHNLKFSYVYELPFGKGRKYMNAGGFSNVVLGGWRLGGVQVYSSGTPVGIGTTVSFPYFGGANRPTVSSYEGWRTNPAGDRFDPFKETYISRAAFPDQPTDRLGNMTRFNPNFRFLPNLSENFSIAKDFNFTEKIRFNLRGEAFNAFNRVLWGGVGGAQTLQDPNFGIWRNQINQPRRLQIALKLYF
ncbi:MAG: TonB-dependent receptor [Acidobacteria bacterium]|nr:TonB-dependent receptor [Acidobacteriota bacterium]